MRAQCLVLLLLLISAGNEVAANQKKLTNLLSWKYVQSCSTSSTHSPNTGCPALIAKQTGWVADYDDGPGAWIRLVLDEEHEINAFKFMQPCSMLRKVKLMKVHFDDHTVIDYPVECSIGMNEDGRCTPKRWARLNLNPRIKATTIKIEMAEMCSDEGAIPMMKRLFITGY